MGTTSERPLSGLIRQLFEEPYRFDFFQAVRLLERAARDRDLNAGIAPVGGDSDPAEEAVRFRVLPSLTFPSGDIARLVAARDTGPVEMTVAFMGLTGPAGVLPQHYTSLLIERAHARHKDRAMLEFFDLFNHRTISLFYRAWEKYRFPIGYERHRLEPRREGPDAFSACLFSLVGLGEPRLRGRQAFDDELVLFYGGHFAHQPRNAMGLKLLLEDFADTSVEVLQFFGQWLYLDAESQTRMPSRSEPDGRNLKLGISTVVGSRVWDVQGRFRIRIGPLTAEQFRDCLPGGSRLTAMTQLIRLYVGPEFDFDIQLVLRRQDVPSVQLGSAADPPSQLGWNTWVRSGAATADADDAVFSIEHDQGYVSTQK